jgi:hypothetical protein
MGMWERLCAEIVATIKHVQDRGDARAEALDRRLQAYEARLVALEARPTLDYKGTWAVADTYGRGAVVTHQGSLWICRSANVSRRPGTDPNIWQLAVKRGSDGKDAR